MKIANPMKISVTLVVVTLAVAAIAVVVDAAKAKSKGTSQGKWADTEFTTYLWQTVASGNADELEDLLATNPEAANTRSGDGRGPLWWAYEQNDERMIKLLIDAGASESERDGDGNKPSEVKRGPTKYAQEVRYEQPNGGKAMGIPDLDDDEDADI